ncbi:MULTISPECIES: hypothetical protein [Mesorhizobium]|nr:MULTISPECIES: hypothetical protein [Mesorhizobium]
MAATFQVAIAAGAIFGGLLVDDAGAASALPTAPLPRSSLP